MTKPPYLCVNPQNLDGAIANQQDPTLWAESPHSKHWIELDLFHSGPAPVCWFIVVSSHEDWDFGVHL